MNHMHTIIHPCDKALAIVTTVRAYVPYSDCGLDAYYLASQALYCELRSMCAELEALGAYAKIANDLSLRDLCIKSGIATIRGKNQMVMNDLYGSFIVLGAVVTDSVDIVEKAKLDYVTSTPCQGCDKCIKACPTGAIKSDGSFVSEQCLRSYQCGGTMPHDIAQLMGTRFLGCDSCQTVCPHNEHIKSIKAPEFVQQAVKHSIQDLKPLRELIGTNYARPKYMTVNAIVYAANSHNIEAIPTILQLSKQEQYRDMAEWALNKLKNC